MMVENIDQAILQDFQGQIESWLRAVPGDHTFDTGAPNLAVAMSGRLQATSSEARRFLTDLVSHGRDCGVNHLQEPFISDELTRGFLDVWTARHEERIRDCGQPGLGFGGSEPSEILALAFIKRPQMADWTLMYSFLKNESVYSFMKRRILELILLDRSRVPGEVIDDVYRLLEVGLPVRDFVSGLTARETLGGMPEIAMARLRKGNWRSAASSAFSLASGSTRQRQDAVSLAEMAGRQGVGVLRALRHDPSVNVALAARSALVYRKLFESSQSEFGEALSKLAGRACPVGVELSLTRRMEGMQVAPGNRRRDSVRRALESSESARVRQALLRL